MWRNPRTAQTTIACKECGEPLVAERSCRRVILTCGRCRCSYELAEYAEAIDEALEEFLGSVPCDRV